MFTDYLHTKIDRGDIYNLNYLHVKSDVSRNPKFACVGIETDTCGLDARAGTGNAYQTYGCYRHR